MSGCSFFEGVTGPIIYYQGTFDPIHKGHYAALEAAMARTSASGAVVVVGDEPNPDKPDRLPVDLRREMAYKMFAKVANVSVSAFSQRETKKALFEHHRVIALIGSDAVPLYVERAKSRFHQFCVSLRYLEERACPSTLSGKEVICVVPSVIGMSSSQIREYLRAHPEIYETGLIEPGTDLDQLDPSVLEFILRNKIYLPTRREEIEQYLSEQTLLGKPCICTCLTSASLDQRKESGRSGDLTFSVANEEGKIFVKAYMKSSHTIDCEAEREGMELVNSFPLLWARALKPMDAQHRSSYSLLKVPFIELPDLAKVFKTAKDHDSVQKLIQVCFCVGRALSELHSHRSYPAQKDSIQRQTQILNDRTVARLKKLPAHQEIELKAHFFGSYEAYLKNPGVHTYVHGDADLSNFVVNEVGRVILIDLGGLAIKRTAKGEPLGCPTEDYYRFLEGIYWFNFWIDKEGVLPISIVHQAQEAFKEGYKTFPSTLTEEAHHYFSNYWKIKNSKFNPDLLLSN